MNNSDKLSSILERASVTSQYYRELNVEKKFMSIDSFPILTKNKLYTNKDKIVADEYRNTLLKECVVHLSSGTAGKPIEVYWHYNDELLSNLSLWRLRAKFYSIKPTNRYCTLHSNNYSWNRIMDFRKIVYSKDRKILSLCKLFFDDESMMQYYNEIMKFQPEWLFFQPSNFIKLTEYMIRNNLEKPTSIRYIEFTGETLTTKATELVKEYYDCNYSNMYGTTETNGIAYMCPYGHMHVLDDNVFLETIPNNFGKAIITSLTNSVFPLIRYEIGDVLKVKKINYCKCGQHGDVIDEITGRQQNFIRLNNGNTISEIVIMSIVERVNSITGNVIKEYKAQVSVNSETIKIIAYIEPYHKARESKITKELDLVLNRYFSGLYKIQINYVYIPIEITENGKFSLLEVVE